MKKFQMTNFDMPNNISYLKHALKSVTGLADVGVLQGDGDGPRAPPRCTEGVWKKFQMTNFDMPTNVSYIKNALISAPGLADVGVPHGDGDGPRTLPRWLEGVWKKVQMTNLSELNNFSSMKYAEKSVPGTADGGVPHEVEVKARFPGA